MTIEEIRAALAEESAEGRRLGVLALEEAPESPEVRTLLVRALGDADWRVRKEAVRVVARRATALGLFDALTGAVTQNDNVGLRNSAIEALGKIGAHAEAHLEDALARSPMESKKFLVAALGEVGHATAVPAIAALLRVDDVNLAAAAVDALARIGGDGAVTALSDTLHAEEPYLRLAVLDALDRLDAVVEWSELEPLLTEPLSRRVALRLLGRTKTPRAVAPLLDALADGSAHTAQSATAALSRLAEESDAAVDALRDAATHLSREARDRCVGLLDTGDREARRGATLLLLVARDERGLRGVVDLAGEDALPRVAASMLRAWGAKATGPLLDLSEKSIGHARAVALELAGDLADDRDADATGRLRMALRHAVAQHEPDLAIAAARTFARWGTAEDTKRLVEATHRGPETLSRAAAEALLSLAEREPSAVEHAVLATELDGVGGAALARVVGHVLGDRAVTTLSAALSANSPATRRAAIGELARLGGERAAEHVGLALTDEDVDVQVAAARALGELRDEVGRPLGADALMLALASGESAVQAAAARALAAIGEKRAIERLRELVKVGTPGASVAAMESLRALSDPALSDLLVEALGHSDTEVVKQALSAIAEVGGERRAARLSLGLSHSAWDVRRLAAQLLGAAGGDDARAALESRLAVETDDLVKGAIADALAMVSGER